MLDEREITGQWDYGSLPANIVVGRNVFLERKSSFERFNSNRKPGLIIGDRARIYSWTTFNLASDAFLEIGDDSVLVGPVFMCHQHIVVGKRCVISYQVTIADSDFHPVDPALRRQDAVANAPFGDRTQRPQITSEPVVIEDDVWIGIGTIVLKGLKIGEGARIAAGSIVAHDVLAGTSVAGNPARICSTS